MRHLLSRSQKEHCSRLQVSFDLFFYFFPLLMPSTVAQCNAAVNALGLPAPPANTPVMEQRRQIAEYLGCPM